MKSIFFLLLTFLISCTSTGKKGAEIFQKNGYAINGYDPVAFFEEEKPVKGNPQFKYRWKDADWVFSTQARLDSFRLAPEKFAPQYGGYCAYGTADGHKAPTEADTWTLQDGKLYFNYNMDVKKLWDQDRAKFILQADGNWEKIKFTD